jgi:signal transduction histidine kinase
MSHKVQTAQNNLRSQVGAITWGQEEERRRLARELHDDTIQSLIALNQRVQLAQLRSEGTFSAELEDMQKMVAAMIADVRRFTHALRPVGLEELGLVPALELLVENSQRQTETPIEFRRRGRPYRLPTNTEFALYRMAQEGLNNTLQHAAAAQAVVELEFAPQLVTLTLRDDGCGFNVPDSLSAMAQAGNFGLLGIYERAQLIGAEVQLESAVEQGTTVMVRVPREQVSNPDHPIAAMRL